MAEADRIAAALRYQQDLDNAQRPAFGNPNMLAQGRKMNLPERQAYSAEAPDWMAKGLPMEGRATILPFRDTESKREIALPGLIASALNSMTAPGRAFSGSDPTFDPMSEGIDFALNTMGGGMAATKAAPVGDVLLGMNLWHGSPHKFPPTAKNPLGEFDPTKIGTGEGAQAYGVGAAYLAEAKDLAKHYRDVLAIDPRDSVNSVRAALSPTGKEKYWGAGENRAKLDEIYFEMQRHPNLQPYLNDSAFKNDILKVINGTNPDGTVTDEAINILRRLDKTMPKPSGQLYKVDLADEQIPKMLDWDKPLSQQAPEVQKALSGIESKFPKIPDFNLRKWMDADPLASTWHNALQRDLGVDPAMISNTLKERGITGIRYLDAGSRNTSAGELIGVAKGADGWQAKIRKTPSGQVGDVIPMAPSITTSKSYPTEQAARDWANSQIGGGTSNFVVFDPKHMNIIGRE